ncbi:hypothetical protein FO519_002755 [Halicephalobus sp. NKZ332]|nr:hypothetical protein FO519_002755 [Halicephalobus sp. NKZ332]
MSKIFVSFVFVLFIGISLAQFYPYGYGGYGYGGYPMYGPGMYGGYGGYGGYGRRMMMMNRAAMTGAMEGAMIGATLVSTTMDVFWEWQQTPKQWTRYSITINKKLNEEIRGTNSCEVEIDSKKISFDFDLMKLKSGRIVKDIRCSVNNNGK